MQTILCRIRTSTIGEKNKKAIALLMKSAIAERITDRKFERLVQGLERFFDFGEIG